MVDIDFSEVDHLAKIIEAAPEQASKIAGVAGSVIGAKVKSAASAAAPIDRPWLSTSGIKVRSWKFKQSSHTDIYTIEDDRGINVGFLQEYGTSEEPPQPFLTPQMEWAAGAYEEAIVAGLEPLGGP